MHHFTPTCSFFLFIFLVAVTVTGCGSDESKPKTEFTDAEKQQIQQLNQQRADEWGNKSNP